MTGVEMLAGAAVMYLVSKFRRVGRRMDAEVDLAMDAGLDALHDLVSGVIGDDRALAALENQAAQGGESERTVRRATDTIAEAAETDTAFAGRLQQLVEELQRRERETSGGGIASSGDAAINVQMKGEASGQGRVYQAGRDQDITKR